MNIVSRAVVTEKSFRLTEDGQYCFLVSKSATKHEITAEIKRLFKVDPISVNTITIKGKTKTRGRQVGQRNTIKKAIVRLSSGQKIAEFSAKES